MTARQVVVAMVGLASAVCGSETMPVPEPTVPTTAPPAPPEPATTTTVEPVTTTTAIVLETPETTLPTLVLPEHAHDHLTDDQWAADPPPAPSPQGRTTRQAPDSGLKEAIGECESGGSYTAANPSSTASGKYQYLDSTWAGYRGYARAKDAPASVQEERMDADLANGTTPWNASRGCWG